jgi:endonuclease YncB( thermonuclease family)
MESKIRHRRRPTPPYPVMVLEVPDGATLIALPVSKLPSGKNAKADSVIIRLYGIDCPEIHEPYGMEAAELLRETALHRQLEVRRGPISKDKAGRTVAIVGMRQGPADEDKIAATVPDNHARPLQEMLLGAGLAQVSESCALQECAVWKKLEAEARAAGSGRWKQ